MNIYLLFRFCVGCGKIGERDADKVRCLDCKHFSTTRVPVMGAEVPYIKCNSSHAIVKDTFYPITGRTTQTIHVDVLNEDGNCAYFKYSLIKVLVVRFFVFFAKIYRYFWW